MYKSLLMANHRTLFPENKFRSSGKEYYEWKIYNNPFAEGDIYLEILDGRVVGSSSLTPKYIASLNEIILGAELGDSFTLSEFRRQGINSRALKHCTDYAISHGMNIIYGGPAKSNNYRLLLKLGCLPNPLVSYTYMTKSFKPLRSAIKTILKIFLFRNVIKNYSYLRYLFYKKTCVLKINDLNEREYKNNFHVLEIDKFHKVIDGLWGIPRYAFCVIRDEKYLNWRYFKSPDKYIVLAAVKGNSYLGYMVLKMSKDNTTGAICDFITVNDRADVFIALVKKTEEILIKRRANSVKLQCIADSIYHRMFRELGYYDHGPANNQYVVIYSKTEAGVKVLKNVGKWHFTYGDTDEV